FNTCVEWSTLAINASSYRGASKTACYEKHDEGARKDIQFQRCDVTHTSYIF
ncbi:unnamed protein product, partial [Nesidiocoris tenuis]